MKLMVSKTLDLDCRELSTCTMPMNGGYYLGVQPAFNEWEGGESPSTPKLNPWEHFVVSCVDILREREKERVGRFCGVLCSCTAHAR